ncbi:MAG TPA: hypothetical protein VGB79_00885 [Allosphingosinicella sp.]
MSASLRAFYPAAAQAEAARAHVERTVPLVDSIIVDRAGVEALGQLGLGADAIGKAAAELAEGGVLLVLVVAHRDSLADVRAALDDHRDAARAADDANAAVGHGEAQASAARPAGAPGLLVGAPFILRPHARVEVAPELPAPDLAEVRAPEMHVTADALASAGLFTGRLLDFAETREEAAVSRRMAVREELVVRKAVEERVQRVAGSVRHTEVAVEELAPRRSAAFVPRGAEPYDPGA